MPKVWVPQSKLFQSPIFEVTLSQEPPDKIKMALKALTDDEKCDLKEQFTAIDKDESG